MTTTKDEALRRRWRMLAWGGATGLLALPAVAMQFTAEVQWDVTDFVTMGTLLFGLAGAFHLLIRRGGFAYQLGSAAALFAVFLLIWLNLAVGIVGDENDPANLLFAGVIAIAVGGAAVARLHANGMARAMVAAAAAQAAILPVVTMGGFGGEGSVWPREVIVLTGFFVVLWLAAAWLFHRAARTAMSTR